MQAKGIILSAKKAKVWRPFLIGLFFFLACQGLTWAGESYRYKRLRPMLQQPWYFREPKAVAVSPAGYVYVADTTNHRIQKFTFDGQFVAKWGSEGKGDGQFDDPQGIAVDADGNVLITDYLGGDVQKFTPDGQFITVWGKQSGLGRPHGIAVAAEGHVFIADSGYHVVKKFSPDGQLLKAWGGEGSSDGQFSHPAGVTVDAAGNVYVADSGNDRIQKFTSDGQFIMKWGKYGIDEGDFVVPYGIAADAHGNIYVADTFGHGMKKFSSEGQFIWQWGDMGGGDGDFELPYGVAVDAFGNVYVADSLNNRLQKFTVEGKFIAKWGSNGSGKGEFWTPNAVAVDSERRFYVLDKQNHRIQKFSALGQFITQWGRYGTGDGQFIRPSSMVVDKQGNVYVTDNYQVQKFSSLGQFITKWGGQGDGDGQFHIMCGIAVDSTGNVYVTDELNENVQKFSSDGQFLTKWGVPATVAHQIWWPNGIAVDDSGNVFVSDRWNMCVHKFSAEGQALGRWGEYGAGDGQFHELDGVAVDALGNVFVVDSNQHRIQKFTSNGQFVALIGGFGSNPGQLNGPLSVAVDANGNVYVAEENNNRISVFEPVSQLAGAKAIVLAGGGPYAGNNLWNATQMVANLAFRALQYQGFAKNQIRYLTSNTEQDLDNNGKFDDLGSATKSNLQTSITEWAKGAEQLLIYLTDHGNQKTFQINANDGEDGYLKADELAAWLEELPSTEVTVIIDACYAGSFLKTLAGSGRVVITSTASAQKAQFGLSGSLSFSNYFWAQVFNGADFHKAFTTGSQAVRFLGNQAVNPQSPQVDADGNGIANEEQDKAVLADLKMLNQTPSYNKVPVVKSRSATPNPIPDGSNTATLRADGVTDADGIQRVWAVIWPPNFSAAGSNPITELPFVDLQPIPGMKDSYEASYGGFTQNGTYYVLLYAMDRQENLSTPKLLKVEAKTARTHKAILVAGGIAGESLFTAAAYNTRLAYHALLAQSYAEEDIRVLSPAAIDETVPVFGAATVTNVREAIQDWAASGTQDLVLYLVGTGESGAFSLGQSEKLYAQQLSAWLASMESDLPGKVILVYDGCHSGSFLGELKGGKRIIMASAGADQRACLANGGISSFSQSFWLQVLDGVNLRDAFLKAQKTMQVIGKNQAAQLDDDGDGVGTAADGQLAKLYRIGPGFSLGSDPPIIQTAGPDRTITSGNKASIWVKDVTTTGTLKKVWAVVVPPDYHPESSATPGVDFPTFRLKREAAGRYKSLYSGFTTAGEYLVTVFAADTEGNVSQPKVIKVTVE